MIPFAAFGVIIIFDEFVAHALLCDLFQSARQFYDRAARVHLDLKIELHGKTHRAHQAQRILAKPLFRRADGANHRGL